MELPLPPGRRPQRFHQGRSFSNWFALRIVSWRSRLFCSSHVLIADRKREWSSSGSETNLNGCISHESGVNISAAAKTDPADVRNMSLATKPCRIGRGKESKPPVIETTFKCPEVRLPSAKRRTAGVVSEKRTRSGRRGPWVETKYGISSYSMYRLRSVWQITEGHRRRAAMKVKNCKDKCNFLQ